MALLSREVLGDLCRCTGAAETAESFSFAQYPIAHSICFLFNKTAFAFVNLKPILPGHMLIAPRRVAPRFRDLSVEEVSDLYRLAQLVGELLERKYAASSLIVCLQDGPAAGQTVEHVHVHVIPRRSGDYEDDSAFYDDLESTSVAPDPVGPKKAKGAKTDGGDAAKATDDDRKPRSMEEMKAEAREMREYIERLHKEAAEQPQPPQ
eukprot:GHVU01082338.1.p2 GENE.GHVU01082338.1~~GHVU01082338.1.p2  ORF type:complete len:207 (+),score=49.06 GHVU01082338.1:675-1295(+)